MPTLLPATEKTRQTRPGRNVDARMRPGPRSGKVCSGFPSERGPIFDDRGFRAADRVPLGLKPRWRGGFNSCPDRSPEKCAAVFRPAAVQSKMIAVSGRPTGFHSAWRRDGAQRAGRVRSRSPDLQPMPNSAGFDEISTLMVRARSALLRRSARIQATSRARGAAILSGYGVGRISLCVFPLFAPISHRPALRHAQRDVVENTQGTSIQKLTVALSMP